MRCLSCNARLTDQESTRKAAVTGEYLDLCNHCFGTIAEEVAYVEGNGSTISSDDLEDDYQQGQCRESGWEGDLQNMRSGIFPAGLLEE